MDFSHEEDLDYLSVTSLNYCTKSVMLLLKIILLHTPRLVLVLGNSAWFFELTLAHQMLQDSDKGYVKSHKDDPHFSSSVMNPSIVHSYL